MTWDLPEEKPIASHSINDPRHREEGAQQAHRQPSHRPDGNNELGSVESVGCKHLHQGRFGINVGVWHHQSQDYAHLLSGKSEGDVRLEVAQGLLIYLFWVPHCSSLGNSLLLFTTTLHQLIPGQFKNPIIKIE